MLSARRLSIAAGNAISGGKEKDSMAVISPTESSLRA
jgi:hypothetical protein